MNRSATSRARKPARSGPGVVHRPQHPATVRVLLVGHQEAVRRGLREMIEAVDDLVVVGEAGSVEDALAEAARVHPDIVVLDPPLPDGDGIELCRDLRARDANLIALILSSFDDDDALLDIVMAGASGCVLRQLRGADLVEAIRSAVPTGALVFDAGLTKRLIERVRFHRPVDPDESGRLTQQEHAILELITRGRTNCQIADELCLAERTVRYEVSTMIRKLGMRRRPRASAPLSAP